MKDIKRIKRHRNTSNTLQNQLLCIVPEDQIQGVPGVYSDEVCNFELYSKPVRPKHNHKDRMKEMIEKRYQTSISNIKFTPQGEEMQRYKHAIAKLPNYTESMSLQYDGWETLKFRRSEYKGHKYNKSTPMSVLRYALVEDRNAKGWNKDHMMVKIDKKIDLAKNDSGHLQDIIDYLNKENDDVEYGADV